MNTQGLRCQKLRNEGKREDFKSLVKPNIKVLSKLEWTLRQQHRLSGEYIVWHLLGSTRVCLYVWGEWMAKIKNDFRSVTLHAWQY